ncbi:MAG: 4-hydroxy-tetrahydrodipicolinate synthase [Fibrobacteria bacterium]|nr:4-hydroxy-tetrahydrodipicolinate synthase [Fibrobacteria bacterium]
MTKTITSAKELSGLYPALFTPIKDDDPKCLNNSIDYKKAEQMIDDLIASGVHGLVPVGTTGQSATLTPAHHVDFIKFTIDYAGDRVPVIAGAGSNCTRESVDTIHQILKTAGEVTFLCVTGYYNNPPQEGLIKHFETLVAETGANIIMYNVPVRTSSYLEAETVIHLSKNDKIIGIKQAVDFKNPGSKREDTLKIIQGINSDEFTLLSGEDDSLFAVLELGGKGMITATGNIPEAAMLFCQILSAYKDGNKEKAAALQQEAEKFVKACFMRKNPVPLATLFNSPVYQPLCRVIETENGESAHQELMELITNHAPSLQKYHD